MVGVRLSVLLMIVGLGVGPGCKKRGGGGGKPKVAVSIFPIYDLTRRVAGDRLEVLLVLPPGKSEHGYDPTPKEIARLDGARLGIAVGLDLDGWVENIMRTAGDSKIVRIGDGVPTIPIDVEPIGEEAHEEHGEEHGEDDHDDHDDHDEPGEDAHDDHDDHHAHGAVGAPDPHVWMDPTRMTPVLDKIATELAAIDPAGKETFARNAKDLAAALAKLDAALKARREAWQRNTIVTFHGSMAYFAKRYDVRIAAVVEPVAGKEPTAAYIAKVIQAIKRSGAAAVFTEPQLAREPGEIIAKEAGVPLGELDPVGGVAGRDSYEALLTWNLDQLEKVLK